LGAATNQILHLLVTYEQAQPLLRFQNPSSTSNLEIHRVQVTKWPLSDDIIIDAHRAVFL
jgi:hypothetical protein